MTSVSSTRTARSDAETAAPDQAAVIARGRTMDALREVFADALASRSRPVIARVPAPLAPIDALARAVPDADATIFSVPGGPAVATLGTHAWIEARGADRVSALRAGIARALAGVPVVARLGATASHARVIGGMAFAPGAADRAPWDVLGDAAFSLPSLTYELTAHGAELAVLFDPAGGPRGLRRTLDDADEALAQLARRDAEPRARRPAARTSTVETSGGWTARIAAILSAIEQGSVHKVVAARCVNAHADASFDPLALIAELGARATGTTLLAVRARGVAFVAATPEQLVSKRGSVVRTMALAGSADSNDPRAAASLVSSTKDLREHALVVAGIRDALSALCEHVHVDAAPTVRALTNVLHLETRIGAEAIAGTHVLDFVGALHPTAAVAGTPTARALAWIAAHEPEPRGWYAGPFGWIDAQGDGELVVALRCALTRGADAWVYGGAGIVAGSDASRELAETNCKMRPMLSALGAPR